jgi:hypothetical protein
MKNISIFFVSLFMALTINSYGQVRSNLADLSPLSRDTLVDLMQQYITADVIEWHCNFINLTNVSNLDIHDDFNFMPYHRVYLEGMEDFLILNGHPEFVPLPYYDPDTPTPTEFRLVDADCMATNCTINVGNGNPNQYCDDDIDWTPNQSIPGYLNDLCDYEFSPTDPWEEDDDGLSRQLEEPYHNEVHEAMGENMFSFASPASPIFWNWHAYLDDMWKDWECNCTSNSSNNTADVDLYLKDNTELMLHTRDRGEEPNIGDIWESGDIWVRNQNDGFTNDTNEEAEYINSTTPVYVYVRVRNRGCSASAISEHQLSLHWSKGNGNSSSTWPSYWNGTITNGYGVVMGDEISTQTIPVIGAQESKILEFEWFPPDPDNFNGNSSNFRLLARKEGSTNDPMAVAEGSDVDDNVDDNNNIAGRGITIVNNAPLPVELTSFSGKRIREENQLSWYTATETQNKGFEIHRSTNAESWEEIGWVDGNGTSNQQHFYIFDDRLPEDGINYYRLKQVDFDGGFGYSEIIAIEGEQSDFDIRVFPNPSKRKFNIQIKNPLNQNMKIQIHNNLGMRVWESDLISDESNWSKELEIERNGIYLISVEIGNEIHFERVVILGQN